MIKKLPLIELKVDPENNSFVSAIALCENPAIESNFIAFNALEATKYTFSDEKMELLGYAMLPNTPIYRKDAQLGEYAVTFSAETIREIAQIFAKKGLNNSLNVEHTSENAGSYVFQSYIVDTEKGISAPKGLESINGAWVIGVKVESKTMWDAVKSGKAQGFSVEGIFDLIQTDKIVDFNFNKEENLLIKALADLSSHLDVLIEKHQL